METALLDWMNLALRWAHVITGIAWIGSSFFFMWLDSNMREAETPKTGVEGEVWMVHGGGFYEVNKFMVIPPAMPSTLHWFKWEAAFTGITGVLLLAVVYYLGSSAFLIDAGSADISHLEAVAIGVGVIVFGWLIYDGLFMSSFGRKNGEAAGGIAAFLLCCVAYWLTQILSSRGAYIHVGALIGIVMVLNVWVRIIPGQRRLIAAKMAGEVPEARLAKIAKQRSVHNNYLTLPIVFVMLSSHYPMTYGHSANWAVLIAISVSGALVRHWFNLRNEGRPHPWPLAGGAAVFLAVALFVSWPQITAEKIAAPAGGIAPERVAAVVQARCVTCHSASPTFEGIDTAPKDVRFDTLAQVAAHAGDVRKTAVETDTMPLGNETGMTAAERQLLGAWIDAGAPLE